MKVLPIFLLLIRLSVAPALYGQSTLGSILGVTQDAMSAVIPDVSIAVRNLDENVTRTAVSAPDGSFQFLNLKPGHYEITAVRDGFADFKIADRLLEARQAIRVEVKLEIARIGTEVAVTTEMAPVMNTENGVISDTKDFKQVTELPVNYRGSSTSALAAINTVPSVQQDSNGNVSIGGGTPAMIQYSVDGVSTVNVRANGALGDLNPSSEMISEFKVTAFNNNAEFSQVGDVTISTKSGGNPFHGSLFEYSQNRLLDATVYGFDNKPKKVFNTFGGSLSGPIFKNRTFFFADYEGNRRRFSTAEQFSTPTQDMRNGILNGLSGPIMDPHTGLPFPNNQIPSNRISTVSRILLNSYYPLPNTGSGTASDTNANLRQLISTPADTNGYDIRVDHNLSATQQIYARWSWKNLTSSVPNGLLPSELDREGNRNLIVSHNMSITPSTLNEFRFGVSQVTTRVGFPISGATAIAQLGLQGLDLSDVPNVNAFPVFNFSDGTGFTAVGRDKTGLTRSTTYQFSDNFTWIKGRHTAKFGADVRKVSYYDLESFGGADDFGQFTFSAGTFSGNAYADFLLGLPATTYVAQSGPDVNAKTTQFGVYGQDEWRVNDRLTMSFGLRWTELPPFLANNIGAFDKRNGGMIIPDNLTPRQGFLDSINACPGLNPALPCAPITKASQAGLGQGLRRTYIRNFQPRLSFAYRPFGGSKTVVRGGFGIYTITSVGQLSFNTTNIPVAVVRTYQNSTTASGVPLWQFPIAVPSSSPLQFAGTGEFYQNVPTDYRDPQSAQWNLTVERELSADVTMRASYTGMNSYRMNVTVDLNQVQPGTAPYNADLRPYRNWGRILSSENLGFANYQAFQLEANKHFSQGLFFQTNYSFGKNLGNIGGDAPTGFSPEVIYGTAVSDRFNLRSLRGNIAGTRRNRFLATSIYDLPVGKNQMFFSTMGSLANAIFGNWEMSTIALIQSGPFQTPTISPTLEQANLNILQRGSVLRPDRVGNGNVANPTGDNYYNISAFAPTPAGAGRVGNAGVGILEGPGTIAISGGLAKSFTLNDKVKMRLEATFTNLPNHVNLAPPAVDVTTPATFGKSTSAQTAENAGNRTGQIALRIQF